MHALENYRPATSDGYEMIPNTLYRQGRDTPKAAKKLTSRAGKAKSGRAKATKTPKKEENNEDSKHEESSKNEEQHSNNEENSNHEEMSSKPAEDGKWVSNALSLAARSVRGFAVGLSSAW